ncbi:MAG: aminotransferase [Rhodobiaceae bacterium]|nr:aminotransferase [Rhodobiaceae bacterium]
MTSSQPGSTGLEAIRSEMARQPADALASLRTAGATADKIADSIRETGQVLFLGMGASHAAGRAVEPLYRALGYDAIAAPLSEQLEQRLSVETKTVLLTSQSGESAEVLRWFATVPPHGHTYGITLDAGSSLAKTVLCLVGAGGIETAFAATRSLTITLALHAAVLGRLGAPTDELEETLLQPATPDLSEALAHFDGVQTIVTSGRRLQGLAEAMALGLCELSRLPCYSLDGGQLRHGPMEMLGPKVGVVMLRAKEPNAGLVANLAGAVAGAGSPVVLFDASDEDPVAGAVTVRVPEAPDLEALFRILPAAQRFMVDFAATRVADVGTPVRSHKITRTE